MEQLVKKPLLPPTLTHSLPFSLKPLLTPTSSLSHNFSPSPTFYSFKQQRILFILICFGCLHMEHGVITRKTQFHCDILLPE
ncbi:hypothetical protein GmHk_09G026972 [Glycine max]|nr:hypothetical protein GmHk_09G026972 [Glycine max]